MRKDFLFSVAFLFFSIVCLGFAQGVSELDVLIVSDDDAIPWYDEITSASYYEDILEGVESNGLTYNITVWNQSLSGSPSLAYLQSFGLVIWTTGAFWNYAPSSIDIAKLESYVQQGGKLIIDGNYILYDWSENSFTQNVLHAKGVPGYALDMNDVNITNITHPVTAGFAENETLVFVPSPGAYNYDPGVVDSAVNGGQVLAVRGDSSSSSGAPAIIVFENSTTPAKVIYIAFPIFLLNVTNRTTLVENAIQWMDGYSPTINSINLAPGNSDGVDPGVIVNVSVNATDIHNVSEVKFEYRCAAGTGCSPGTENFVNITFTYNGTAELYENVSFTPNVSGNWQYRVWAEDDLGNLNRTEIYNLSVTYDLSWTRTPSFFETVSCFFSTVCTLGNIVINNTGDYSLDFDLSSNYEDTSFNVTEPFTLGAKGVKIIQVNATAGDESSESNIILTMNSTTSNAVPERETVNVTLISYAGGPFFRVSIMEDISSANQSGTVNLSSRVENLGNETATGTWLNWTLPSGWTNISGNLTQNIGSLASGAIAYNNITVELSASTAQAGIATVYSNATSLEGANDSDSDSINIYCSNSDSICGAGCTYLDDNNCEQEVITVSSGGGGGGNSNKTINFSRIVEIIRGEEKNFSIEVYNKDSNSIIHNITLNVTGFLPQYISVFPQKIDMLYGGEKKNFTIKIKVPSYKSREEHILTIVVQGRISFYDKTSKTTYSKIENIKLIIQEATIEEVNLSLIDAESAIELMKKEGFNTAQVEKLLKDSQKKIEERNTKEAEELANQILYIRALAFESKDLINRVEHAVLNPKNMWLLTEERGLLEKSLEDKKIYPPMILTGKSIVDVQPAKNLLNLAKAAFERGDYESAKERIQTAQTLLLLEVKGNVLLFVYIYWPFIFLGVFLFSLFGMVGFRKYQKVMVNKKIEDINLKEKNILNMICESQKNYFLGKISSSEYYKLMEYHQKQITHLRGLRINLRNKRILLLKPRQILLELGVERMQVESEIEKIQKGYYSEKSLNKSEYESQFHTLNERLAEIEEEKLTLHLLEGKPKKSSSVKSEKNLPSKEKIPKKEVSKSLFNRLISFFKKSSRKKNNQGDIFLHGGFLKELIEKISKIDCKNKWLKINFK